MARLGIATYIADPSEETFDVRVGLEESRVAKIEKVPTRAKRHCKIIGQNFEQLRRHQRKVDRHQQ